MTAKVILNPYAGRWTALKRRDEACAALQAAGIDYELALTTAPGHAMQLAAEAVAQGYSPLVAAGGDGTISEVVNGMAQACAVAPGVLARPLPPLGILPLGSANDLVANLQLPTELGLAAHIIAGGAARSLDLCMAGERYFDNNAAMGLEPYITLIQQRITAIHGDLRYLLATVRGVLDNPQWRMRLEWQGGEYEGPVTLVTVGNNPRTGGVFYVTPHADPADGLLTFVYGYLPGRLSILSALPMTMKPAAGNYVEHPAINEVHSPWLRVSSQPASPLHADGEIQTTAAGQVEFRVLPGQLTVLAPQH